MEQRGSVEVDSVKLAILKADTAQSSRKDTYRPYYELEDGESLTK